MPLYNLEENRNIKSNDKITKTDSIHIRHNYGVRAEEQGNVSQLWEPVTRKMQGYISCKENPPFPEASIGEMFFITDSGTIGGVDIKKGDAIECIVPFTEEGYSEDIKNNWLIYNSASSDNDGEVVDSDKTSVKYDSFTLVDNYLSKDINIGTIIKSVNIKIIKPYSENAVLKIIYPDKKTTEISLNMVSNDNIEVIIGKSITIPGKMKYLIESNQYDGFLLCNTEFYNTENLNSVKSLTITMNSYESDIYNIPFGSLITNLMVISNKYNGSIILMNNDHEFFKGNISDGIGSFVISKEIHESYSLKVVLDKDKYESNTNMICVIEYIPS